MPTQGEWRRPAVGWRSRQRRAAKTRRGAADHRCHRPAHWSDSVDYSFQLGLPLAEVTGRGPRRRPGLRSGRSRVVWDDVSSLVATARSVPYCLPVSPRRRLTRARLGRLGDGAAESSLGRLTSWRVFGVTVATWRGSRLGGPRALLLGLALLASQWRCGPWWWSAARVRWPLRW